MDVEDLRILRATTGCNENEGQFSPSGTRTRSWGNRLEKAETLTICFEPRLVGKSPPSRPYFLLTRRNRLQQPSTGLYGRLSEHYISQVCFRLSHSFQIVSALSFLPFLPTPPPLSTFDCQLDSTTDTTDEQTVILDYTELSSQPLPSPRSLAFL